MQEFIEEGVGAIKDYFQNITFLLMPDTQEQPLITKSSVLGKKASQYNTWGIFILYKLLKNVPQLKGIMLDDCSLNILHVIGAMQRDEMWRLEKNFLH